MFFVLALYLFCDFVGVLALDWYDENQKMHVEFDEKKTETICYAILIMILHIKCPLFFKDEHLF